MNIQLLRSIAEKIKAKPSQFEMKYLHSCKGRNTPFRGCGTAHCIVGWAAILLDRSIGVGEFLDYADITPQQEFALAYVGCWPEPFRGNYLAAKTKKTKAKIAVEYIEHFIATEE